MYLQQLKVFVFVIIAFSFVVILTNLSAFSIDSIKSEANMSFVVQKDQHTANLDVSLITYSQASHFNHHQQRNITYLFAVLLALFIHLTSVAGQRFPTVKLPPPWFCLRRGASSSRLCGWKDSNLLYKSKLTYQD